jgi:hypothetical protein
MAITQHASGTQAATITTEHFLGTDPDTTAGVFQFLVELSAMARADTLEIRVYEKVNDSGDTARQIAMWPVLNEQTDLLFVSPALVLLVGWRFSIKQTTGTGRSFQWSVRKVA